MKLLITLILITLILVPTTIAKSENSGSGNSGKSEQKQEEKDNRGSGKPIDQLEVNNQEIENEEENETETKRGRGSLKQASSSGKLCDPNSIWKNHGDYVSCVARSGAGPQAVAEAARSDIGKKNKNSTPSASLSPSPVASSSAEPSPDATSSAEPEATTSGNLITETAENIVEQFSALKDLITDFFSSLNLF